MVSLGLAIEPAVMLELGHLTVADGHGRGGTEEKSVRPYLLDNYL